LPRAISARLTGTVTTKATTRETTNDTQNKPSVSLASKAPGTARMKALSMTSMVAIEMVSAANAMPTARRSATPDLRTGIMVSEYPNTKASTTANATLGQLPHFHHVARTIPRTSPIAQPVRQCSVADTAIRHEAAADGD
jgi:hypothetical protein